MKKFILGLGTVASAVAPIAAVVACGTDSNGLPTLTAEESTTLINAFATELGFTLPSGVKDAFQIKVTKVSETGVEFTLERNAKSSLTTAPLAFTNLVKSTTALELAIGEALKFNLEFNADKTGLKTKTFTLSNAKTTAKNGEYTAKTSSALTDTKILNILKAFVKRFIGVNETITLTDANKTTVINTLGTSAISAEVIFRDNTGSTDAPNASPLPATWNHLSSARLISKTNNAKATFEFTFELTLGSGEIKVFGETETLVAASGGKVTIHLIGTMGTSGYTLTTKTATFNSKTVTLNEAGSKKLAAALYSVATT